MPGGLLQLISYGVEDIYSIGEPQITFLKNFKRYTNLAIDTIECLTNNTPDFNKK